MGSETCGTTVAPNAWGAWARTPAWIEEPGAGAVHNGFGELENADRLSRSA
jgi:hypothetical protein